MSEHGRPPASTRLTLVAYSVTSLALASAWLLRVPSGLWLGNAIAGFCGVGLGLWTLSQQGISLFKNAKRDVPVGILLGCVLVLFSHAGTELVLRSLPFASREIDRLYAMLRTPPGPKLGCPILVLVVLAEELVFRGAVTTWLAQRCPAQQVIVLSTLLYALPLLLSGSWLLPLVGLVLGSLFAWTRQRSQGLWVPLFSHVVWSVAMFVWLPA